MKKTLVLIRHAHRDTETRALDNGLSEKGQMQARWLRKYFLERFAKCSEGEYENIWFVSSPKVRCRESLAPMASAAKLKLDINPDLLEQKSTENAAAFERRVLHFLGEWQRMPQPLTIVCSHGDWLPIAVFRLLGCKIDFKKASWLEIEWDSHAQLKSFIPGFKSFYG
jgi:broad specificity phosphatase PhoE